MPIGGIPFDLPAVAGPLARTLTTLLLLGGCPDDDDSHDSDATSDSAATGSMSSGDPAATAANTEAAMTGDAESSTGLGGTTAGTTGSGDTQATTGDSSGGEDASTSDTGGAQTGTTGTASGSVQCAERCAVEHPCIDEWKSEEACAAACDANLEQAAMTSTFCQYAWEDLATCQGGLSCKDFLVWQDPVKSPYPCMAQDVLLAVECKGQ